MSNESPVPKEPSFAERVPEYEWQAIILGAVDGKMEINAVDVYSMIACIREYEAALEAVLPVADEMCANYPNDDCYLVPRHKARAALTKWRLK